MSETQLPFNQENNRFRYRIILLNLCALLLQFHLLEAKADTHRQVAPGIVFTEKIETGLNPMVVHCLDIDLNRSGIRVRTGQALDRIEIEGKNSGREQVSTLSARNHAFAAVNGDFFPFTGDPLGLSILNGELLSEPPGYRASIGFGQGGPQIEVLGFEGSFQFGSHSAVRVDGVNRLPGKNEIVVLSPAFHSTPVTTRPLTVLTVDGIPLPLRLGVPLHGRLANVQALRPQEHLPSIRSKEALLIADPSSLSPLDTQLRIGAECRLNLDLYSNQKLTAGGRYPSPDRASKSQSRSPVWREVQNAVGGGPLLLKNGRIEIDSIAEEFDTISFVNQRHPRTAAGITSKGHLLLVVVDGRASFSQGASLLEMATLMKIVGAKDAINLDGGGSTTMVVSGAVVNAPSDGRERYVANALMVDALSKTPALDAGFQIRSPLKHRALTAGTSASFTLIDAAQQPVRRPIVWGTQDGLGFITQEGRFVSYHAGEGAVVATIGTHHFSVPIHVQSAAPAILRCALTDSGTVALRSAVVSVALKDLFGNPVANQSVSLQIVGGSGPDHISTDSAGHAQAPLIWSQELSRCHVRLQVNGLPAQTLRALEANPRRSPSAIPIDPDERP